jgi:hypothetical protein
VAWLTVPPPGRGVPDAKSVVVNGLLVQNLVGAPSPNRSFWSIAVEAQLYVLFPLLLLIVRRWGPVVMVAAVTLVVATVGVLSPHHSLLHGFVTQSAPDLAALFALGVVSAGIVSASADRRSWPWAGLALATAAPVVAMIGWQGSVWTLDHLLWVDLALGPAVACLLTGLGHRPSGPSPAAARRAADPRPRLVVLQPVPDARPDRHRRLRDDRCRPGRPGRSRLRRLPRPGGAADDRVRAGLRLGLRDAVQARPPQVPGSPHGFPSRSAARGNLAARRRNGRGARADRVNENALFGSSR